MVSTVTSPSVSVVMSLLLPSFDCGASLVHCHVRMSDRTEQASDIARPYRAADHSAGRDLCRVASSPRGWTLENRNVTHRGMCFPAFLPVHLDIRDTTDSRFDVEG